MVKKVIDDIPDWAITPEEKEASIEFNFPEHDFWETEHGMSIEEHDAFFALINAVVAGGIPYGRAIIMVASFAAAVQERTRSESE